MGPTKERGFWILKLAVFVAEFYERLNPSIEVLVGVQLKPELDTNIVDIFPYLCERGKGGE